MKVGILAPIDNSPFALCVAERCRREAGVELGPIIVREHLNLARLRSELRRDGVRLLHKVWRKLLVPGPEQGPGRERGFYDLGKELEIEPLSLAALARRYDVPYLKVIDHNAPESITFLDRYRPEAVAFTGGGMVRRPLIQACAGRLLNAHMGVLPAYRGMDVVEWPILEAGVGAPLGVTLHLIDPGLDTGPIVAVWPVPTRLGDSMERLRTRFEPVMLEAMLDGIRRIRDETLQAKSQELAAGRQYYVMHPRLGDQVRSRLATIP